MSDREALDALQQDMADHQRRFVGEVTGEQNRQLMAAELERVDQMLAERKPEAETPPPPAPPPAPTIARESVAGREYLLRKEPDRPLVRVASPLEAEFLTRATARVELLLSLGDSGPLGAASWRDRLMAVMATKAKAASWKAAADAPEELAHSRATLEKDQRLLKTLGLETISQLTPAFARAKAAELEQQYLAEFLQVLEDSNALGFGDWKNPPAPNITIAV